MLPRIERFLFFFFFFNEGEERDLMRAKKGRGKYDKRK